MPFIKKNASKKFDRQFVLASLLILALLVATLVFLRISLGGLLTALKTNSTDITLGALEKFQTGDLLITKADPFSPEASGEPIIKDTDQTQGPRNAPITLVEYTDFLCPYCAQIQPLIKQAQAAYPGKIRLIFKDAPNENLHPGSWLAHQAAWCAQNQNKFWPFAELLWAQVNFQPTATQLTALAKILKLNLAQFNTCLSEQETLKWIWLNNKEAEALNISNTPFFYLNQKPLGSTLTWESLKQTIDQELAK
ncbi:MAG: thioredoxin domain-containing protein [Candidatus Buchananbacteria bacterium]